MNETKEWQSYKALENKCDVFWAKHEPTGFTNVHPKEWEMYQGYLDRQHQAMLSLNK